MENNTKIAIGLAAAVVVGYIVYNKSKNPKSTTSSGGYKCTGQFAVECNDGSCDVGNGKNAPCLGERGGVKGTKADPECICDSYPCNCGASSSDDYGYGNPTMKIKFASKESEKAFWTAFTKKYRVGGVAQNFDVLDVYPYGKFRFTNGYWEQVPYYEGPE
jgi:hypothetical protein